VSASEPLLRERVAALVAAYERIDETMRGLGVHNDALRVEAVAFVEQGDGWLGVLVTPWFMNAVRLPLRSRDWTERPEGEVVSRVLPSGRYDFTLVRLDGVEAIESCSIISPMAGFDDHQVALLVAREAREALMRSASLPAVTGEQTHRVSAEPEPAGEVEVPRARRPVTRRGLLRGRLVGGG